MRAYTAPEPIGKVLSEDLPQVIVQQLIRGTGAVDNLWKTHNRPSSRRQEQRLHKTSPSRRNQSLGNRAGHVPASR